MLPHQEALSKAIEIAGSQAELGRKSGRSQQLIHYYLTDAKRIPFDAALAISRAVDGAVKPSDFIPELAEDISAA